MNRLKRLEKLHRLKLQPMSCEAPQTELHETEKHVVFMSVLTTLDRLSLSLIRCILLPVNPLSPNIHKQILLTDLYTFL